MCVCVCGERERIGDDDDTLVHEENNFSTILLALLEVRPERERERFEFFLCRRGWGAGRGHNLS